MEELEKVVENEEEEGKKIIHHVVAVSCVSGASCHLWCWFLKAHAAYRLTPLDKGVCQVDYRSFLMVYLLYCLKKEKKKCAFRPTRGS